LDTAAGPRQTRDMPRLIGISGSLRRGSLNAALLNAAAASIPTDADLSIESIAAIPLYNGDDEVTSGVPQSVAALKDTLADADGLILCTPEYNNSVPGVLKNAIDWLSRPAADRARVFGGLPVAIMGASPGRFGTVLAQTAWLPIFHTLGANLWSGRLLVSGATSLFNEDGELVDDTTQERLASFVGGFLSFVRQGPPRRPLD